jgi:hypothetical protein
VAITAKCIQQNNRILLKKITVSKLMAFYGSQKFMTVQYCPPFNIILKPPDPAHIGRSYWCVTHDAAVLT